MSFVINPYRYAVSGPPYDPSVLFGGGEVGDWWVFDPANTDAAVDEDPITVATGLVNGLILEDAGTTPPTLQDVGGGKWAARTRNDNSGRLFHTFGSSVAQPLTIILCVGDSDTSTHILCTGSSSGSRCQISNSGGGDLIMFAGSTLDTTINEPPASTPKVFTAQFNGGSSLFRSNGTQTATGNAGTQGTNQLTLGALYDGTFPGSVNFYAALFIDRILTAGAGNELDLAERGMGVYAGLTW